jgi:subtilisin family serine protease
MKRFAVVAAVLFTVAACQDATSPRPIAAPPAGANAAQGNAKGDYIVVLSSDDSDPAGTADRLLKKHGGQLKHMYRKALKGFAASNLSDQAVAELRNDPDVQLVEADGIMSIDGTQSPVPSWGLDRIDAASGLDNIYTYPNTASNVTAYIIDTGINPNHTEFTGRVVTGVDYVDGGEPTDCNGHGTHVAGTVGGTNYGVAKGVTIVAVRVLNCSGSGYTSGVIQGVDWVASNAQLPAVANMSLGGGASLALDQAVANAIAQGVVFAVAAGNSSANACNYSPARTASAITVGATTSGDALAYYSNYGTCVDILAPGSSIKSAWWSSTTATNTISGTSMASPHVAGAAALMLGAGYSASQVRDELVNRATDGAIGGLSSDTPNKLLFVGTATGGDGNGGTGGGTSLGASFTKSCSGFTCTFTSTSSGPITSTTWSFSNGPDQSGTTATVSADARTGYTVTLAVSDGTSNATANGSVTCNPKKCQ